MKKTVNSDKAPKDRLLHEIMQEINAETTSTQTTNYRTNKTKSQTSTWKKWFINSIFLLLSLIFIFVLAVIYNATKEMSNKEPASVKTVEKNKRTEENIPAKKLKENRIIFNMKAKVSDAGIKKTNYIPSVKTKEKEPLLSERDKAKALLREQMNR